MSLDNINSSRVDGDVRRKGWQSMPTIGGAKLSGVT